MDLLNKPEEAEKASPGKIPPKLKTFIFVLEISLIIAILVLWFSSDSLQQSKNLWVLFLYSFPAEFLIAIVPHEPVILFFGKFYAPLTVALISVAGTLLTEAMNYSVIKYMTGSALYKKLSRNKAVAKLIGLFNKKPFVVLLIAGFTPVPFYPFRFLVVMARYSVWKYLLAVFLSRTPRFFLLSLVGQAFQIPDSLLVIFFVVIIAVINIPVLKNLIKKKKKTNAP